MPTDRTDKPAAHGDRRLAEQDSRIAERGYTPPKGRVSMADFSDLPAGPAPGATAAAAPAEQESPVQSTPAQTPPVPADE